MADDRNWFLTERSEALASLMLTSRHDLIVRHEHKGDDGVDFWVALAKPEKGVATKIFVVQVKGTLSSKPEDGSENVKQLYKKDSGHFYLPACVFIVNVRSNDAAYAWVAEPEIKNSGVALNFCEHPAFRPLNTEAVNQIVNRVAAWYDAMPRSVASQAS